VGAEADIISAEDHQAEAGNMMMEKNEGNTAAIALLIAAVLVYEIRC
jgi:hypothetical protein